ncbi:hypothetical protein CEQ90_00235 [Lewinellaceae bacterium SD302]|nr:hypothetical protein CEQ90_00235 [Lewinellaceae bacterium SD302]
MFNTLLFNHSRFNSRVLPALLLFLVSLVNTLSAQACTEFGGEFTLDNGESAIFVCTDDGVADGIVTVLNDNTNTPASYLVTTPFGVIISTQTSSTFNFEGTGDGPVFIYNIATGADFTGSIGVGDNVCNLTPLDGCFSLSTYITVVRLTGEDCEGLDCDVDGGELALEGGGNSVTICAGDGESDAFDVELDGTFGDNMAWLITDTEGVILGLPDAPPFDLDGAGPGVCLIWNISFEDDLEGLEVGADADDLEGCFDLSTPIQVIRNQPEAGTLVFENDMQTAVFLCLNDGSSTVVQALQMDSSSLSGTEAQFIITDSEGMILGAGNQDGSFDVGPAGEGSCVIYYLTSFDEIQGDTIGGSIDDITGCFDLSNGITTVRQQADAGTISFEDGSDEVTLCLNDGSSTLVQAIFEDVSILSGTDNEFIITDGDGMILGMNASGGFDVGPAGPGACVIYYLAGFGAISGDTVGGNINNLEGCFDLSNGITTIRNEANAGSISFEDGSNEVILCLNDGSSTVVQAVQNTPGDLSGDNAQFIITDGAGMILGAGNQTGTFDVGPAGPGACVIYYVNAFGPIQGDTMGGNIEDLTGCFDITEGIVTVRNEANAGELTFDNGDNEILVCLDPDSNTVVQAVQVDEESLSGDNAQFIITDGMGMILGAGNQNGTFDVGPAGIGNCVIYYLNSFGEIQGDTMGGMLDDITGCFDLSNGITTIRQFCEDDCEAEAGELTFEDGSTEILVCLDDSITGTVVQAIQVDSASVSGENVQFIITDGNGMILGAGNETGTFDVGPAGVGNCVIYYLASDGEITGDTMGGTLDGITGCFDLSNGITTVRQFCDDDCEAEAGELTFEDGNTEILVCLDDSITGTVVQAIQVDSASVSGENVQFIITDGNGMILGAGNETGTFDVGPAGVGNCVIFYLVSDGEITGDTMGGTLDGITGCFDLSNGIVTVREEECEDFTGNVVINEVTAQGQVEILNLSEFTVNLNNLYLVTSLGQNRLDMLTTNCGSLTLAPGEVVLFDNVPGLGIMSDEIALFNSSEFIANNLLDYLNWGDATGNYLGLAIAAGQWDASQQLVAPTTEQSLQLVDEVNGISNWFNAIPTPCAPNASPSSVFDPASGITAELFPNPVREQLSISLSGGSFGESTITVFDQTGRRLLDLRFDLSEQVISIPTNELAAGTYYLRISNGENILTDRFVKLQ